MSETVNLKLGDEDYVILSRGEYERLTGLARAADLPAVPRPDRHGNVPAVGYARASLARKLIRERCNAGLSQRQLARLAGIRFETICRIEKGRHTPSVPTIDKIDRALRLVAAVDARPGRIARKA